MRYGIPTLPMPDQGPPTSCMCFLRDVACLGSPLLPFQMLQAVMQALSPEVTFLQSVQVGPGESCGGGMGALLPLTQNSRSGNFLGALGPVGSWVGCPTWGNGDGPSGGASVHAGCSGHLSCSPHSQFGASSHAGLWTQDGPGVLHGPLFWPLCMDT